MDDDRKASAPGGPINSPEPFLLPAGDQLVKLRQPGESPEVGSRAWFRQLAQGRHPGTVHVMRYFAWLHLPESLRQVSAPFGYLAETLLALLPDGPELSAALRKLVEAKDCATRAMVDKLDQA